MVYPYLNTVQPMARKDLSVLMCEHVHSALLHRKQVTEQCAEQTSIFVLNVTSASTKIYENQPKAKPHIVSVAVSRGWNSSVWESFRIRINNTYLLSLQKSTSFNTFPKCLLCAALARHGGSWAASWPLPSWGYRLQEGPEFPQLNTQK